MASTGGREFRVEGVDLVESNRIRLRFTSDPACYYVVLGGDEPGNVTEPKALAMDGPILIETSGRSGFFRLVKYTRSMPADIDQDGFDDLSELMSGTNPLLPN